MDADGLKVWSLILELTEKLNNNRSVVVGLQKQAGELKEKADEMGKTYNLRRLNVDISKEIFESEYERTNAAIVLENHALLYENRQLNNLLGEYENALQAVMGKFRSYTQATASHKLAMTRHYETLLASQSKDKEAPAAHSPIANFNESVWRLTSLLKVAIHLHSSSTPFMDTDAHDPNPGSSPSISPIDSTNLEEMLMKVEQDESGEGEEDGREDWAVEREYEIQRLEKENMELRRVLGILPSGDETDTDMEKRREEFGLGRSICGDEGEGMLHRRSFSSSLTSPGPTPGGYPNMPMPYGRPGSNGYQNTRGQSPPIAPPPSQGQGAGVLHLQQPGAQLAGAFRPRPPITLHDPPRPPNPIQTQTLKPSGSLFGLGRGGVSGSGPGSPLALYKNVALPPVADGPEEIVIPR